MEEADGWDKSTHLINVDRKTPDVLYLFLLMIQASHFRLKLFISTPLQ
jgi:hypothetical protein